MIPRWKNAPPGIRGLCPAITPHHVVTADPVARTVRARSSLKPGSLTRNSFGPAAFSTSGSAGPGASGSGSSECHLLQQFRTVVQVPAPARPRAASTGLQRRKAKAPGCIPPAERGDPAGSLSRSTARRRIPLTGYNERASLGFSRVASSRKIHNAAPPTPLLRRRGAGPVRSGKRPVPDGSSVQVECVTIQLLAPSPSFRPMALGRAAQRFEFESFRQGKAQLEKSDPRQKRSCPPPSPADHRPRRLLCEPPLPRTRRDRGNPQVHPSARLPVAPNILDGRAGLIIPAPAAASRASKSCRLTVESFWSRECVFRLSVSPRRQKERISPPLRLRL